MAIDTAGVELDKEVLALLDRVDIALLDVKFTNESDYKQYTVGSLEQTLEFLEKLNERNIPTWIRHVVVPGLNDTKDDVEKLKSLVDTFDCVEKIDLLAFRKLCQKKYEELGLKFALESTEELSNEKLEELKAAL